MSDNEYTPSLGLIREDWSRVVGMGFDPVAAERAEFRRAAFDRAVAAHDAELTERVRAEQREVDARIVLTVPLDSRHERVLRRDLASAIRKARKQ